MVAHREAMLREMRTARSLESVGAAAWEMRMVHSSVAMACAAAVVAMTTTSMGAHREAILRETRTARALESVGAAAR